MPFWVDLTLEPATLAYALLLALVAAAMIGLLPALKATGASVQRGLQGIASTGGTMKFGGIWSFIVGAQVACTLLFVPAAVDLHQLASRAVEVGSVSGGALPPPSASVWTTRRWPGSAAPDEGQIGARRARAYEELASRVREEPGVTHVTHGDRLPTMFPEWVAVAMEQDGASPARLQGNYEGGFAMAAVGAGYHDAFGAKIVAGRGLHTSDAAAPNGPVVVNEAFMRVVGRNPVGARVRTLEGGSAGAPGPWHEVVGVVTNLEMLFSADWGGAASSRAASAAELDPVVVAVRVAGDAAPLAPRVAALAGQVDAGLHLRGYRHPRRDRRTRSKQRWWPAASSSAPFCSWRVIFSAAGLVHAHGRRRGASHPRNRDPHSPSARPHGACSAACSPVPGVSSAVASSPATASSCSSRGGPTA